MELIGKLEIICHVLQETDFQLELNTVSHTSYPGAETSNRIYGEQLTQISNMRE